MTTEIYRHRIEHPIAWSGSDFRGKDAIAFDLSARQVTALEDIVMRTAALPRDEVSREHCGHQNVTGELCQKNCRSLDIRSHDVLPYYACMVTGGD